MFDLIIGAGEGGGRIAKTFSDTFLKPAIYLNFCKVDFLDMDIGEDDKLVMDTDGTGRDWRLGEYYTQSYKDKIQSFLDSRIEPEGRQNILIIFCSGGG